MSDSSLDPADWNAFRALAHRALDDAIDGLEGVRRGPAWREVPAAVKRAIAGDPLPLGPTAPADVYDEYLELIAPYSVGNRHPRFFGWVHGSGTASGMLAELLAASLDVNAGGRDHAASYIERRVVAWFAELFGFPQTAGGIVTTGTSMANLIAVIVARQNALGVEIRQTGLARAHPHEAFVAYASEEAHGSIAAAFDLAGFGSDTVRRVPVDRSHRIDLLALRTSIIADRARGLRPLFIAGTAGSASVGAVDDLRALADICADEGCWFHVDGAFGAMAVLSPEQRPLLAGIERADSLAFDFHKWLHVPYDAGCVLVRDGALLRAAFEGDAPYLKAAARGTAAGDPWYCDLGPELSRGFRALKVWWTLKEFGLQRFGGLIAEQCRLARATGERVAAMPELELLAPVTLNIVAFRYAGEIEVDEGERDALNAEIAIDLQEQGIAVVSTSRVGGKLGLHLNIMNHRTTAEDLEWTIGAIVACGEAKSRAGAALDVGRTTRLA
ncbi:MAG: aspartate aminotransferase family protein [Candidatus Velthaea sp.]